MPVTAKTDDGRSQSVPHAHAGNRGGTAEPRALNLFEGIRFVLIEDEAFFVYAKMTRYFITGGLGFLGQYIVKAIHDHDPGAELRVLVRTQRKTFLGIEALERVRWVRGDLLQPETYADSLRGVDVVVHNAAKVSFRKAEAEAIIRSNVNGTRLLAEAARAADCPNLVFVSSISSVGFNPNGLTDETMYPDLETKRRTDAYGYSKLVSETELKRMTNDMRVVILNPSVILGPGSDRIDMAIRAVKLLPVMPMLQYVNSFVDVRDAARAVLLALTRGGNGERYIVTAWNEDMVEFTRTVLRLADKKTRILPLTGRGVKLMDAFLWALDAVKLNPGIRRLTEINVDKACSSEKIRREMGWEPTLTLEQSIKDTFSVRERLEN
ncbi:MAG: NAD-dependent epimerase/dehydratase family protein [Chloroflexota bacterium]|jgi:dihydroflavonol-4-reductase